MLRADIGRVIHKTHIRADGSLPIALTLDPSPTRVGEREAGAERRQGEGQRACQMRAGCLERHDQTQDSGSHRVLRDSRSRGLIL